jgi:hypothetical protein
VGFTLREAKMEIFILLVWVLCAVFCYSQANKKNLNAGLWGVLGLLFGIFAVIGVLIVSPKTKA